MTLINKAQTDYINYWFWQYPELKKLIRQRTYKDKDTDLHMDSTEEHFADWVNTLSISEAQEMVNALHTANIDLVKFLLCKYAYEDNTGDVLNLTIEERSHYYGDVLANQFI